MGRPKLNCLIIGAGATRREGWKTLDANPAREPDFLGTIPPLPAEVKEALWDEVEWIHGVTSLYPWEARDVLQELHRAMAPGGKLIMEQPNFDICCGFRKVASFFGDPTTENPLHMNRWSYNPESLTALLVECGFGPIELFPAQHHSPNRDFRIEAIA